MDLTDSTSTPARHTGLVRTPSSSGPAQELHQHHAKKKQKRQGDQPSTGRKGAASKTAQGAQYSHGATFTPPPPPGDNDDSDDADGVTTAEFEKVMGSRAGRCALEKMLAAAANNAAKIASREALKAVQQQQLAMVPQQQQAAKTLRRGKASERGPRMRCAILATAAFVKANKYTRDNGEVVNWSPTTGNCPAKKAVFELMRYEGNVAMSDKDVQKAVNDGSTARRSEHLKWTKEGTRVALLEVVQETATRLREANKENPAILEEMTRQRFYNRVLIQVGLLNPNNDIYLDFIAAFLRQVLHEGLLAVVPDFNPIPATLFGEGTTDLHLCDEIMKPILQAAIMAVRFEPVPGDKAHESFDDLVETVERQLNRVLQDKGKSVYDSFQRSFVNTIWETGYLFQFGPGRFASKLLDMKVSDITERDAVNAFIPYLDNPTNGPGFDDDGRAIDEEDDDGSGGDLNTKPVNDEAGGQGGADENDDGSGENKEMADAGAGASGSVVRGSD